jgi:methylated-DNA-[protein]-cysteine S-methyltransferase
MRPTSVAVAQPFRAASDAAAVAQRLKAADHAVVYRSIIPTPLGEMLALATDEGLCALEFAGPHRLTRLDARSSTRRHAQGGPESSRRAMSSERLEILEGRLRRWFPPHEIVDDETPTLGRTREWLERYFDGTSARIDGLPLAMHGAPFEKRVWEALVAIPPGHTTSYGAIAKALGSPRASRAVGAANGANPISIIVPCHRVIGSSGSLTGYGGGLDRKKWLIDHERRWREGSLF